jgi:uncharacterized protein with HEPN domain
MPRDAAILLDIMKAAHLVSAFVQGMAKEQFMQDVKTQSAVQHQLMVIGEATKRLSPAFRDQHASIPWSLMSGMRNHLIHGYDTVDLDEVWLTATRDMPALVRQLMVIAPPDSSTV